MRDSRDYVIFSGRLKDTLRISHHMVAPSEIEAFLIAHPAVSQAFVVGVPDAKAGEVPVAYVILKDGARLDESELHRVLPREDRRVQDSAGRAVREGRAAHAGPAR